MSLGLILVIILVIFLFDMNRYSDPRPCSRIGRKIDT